MELWRAVFRRGIVPLPQVTYAGLLALYIALLEDSTKIIQGATTSPPPLITVQDWPVEASDTIAYLYWQGKEDVTVGEAEEFFAQTMYACDQLLGEPAACRHYLNWADMVPRDVMRRELLLEVAKALEIKKEMEYRR